MLCSLALVILATGAIAFRQWQVNASNERNCRAVSEWVQSRGDFAIGGDGSKRVAVLGDSYAAGEKLHDRSDGWAFQLGRGEGWTVLVDGIGNTGFTSGGFCGDQAFGTRAQAIKDLRPDLLIVQGGLNDTGAEPEAVEAGADALLDEVHAMPDVVVIGPMLAPAREGVEDTDAALSAAAAKHSRRYISSLDWGLPLLPDNLHLTEAGHVEYAQRVAAILSSSAPAQE